MGSNGNELPKLPGETKEQATERVLHAIRNNASLHKACRIPAESVQRGGVPHWPSPATFLLWCDADPALAQQYALAQATGIRVLFDELREITDEELPRLKDGRIDGGLVQLKKLQTDTRRWELSKRKPEQFGDRVAMVGAADAPPIKMTVEQRAERVAQLLELAEQRRAAAEDLTS